MPIRSLLAREEQDEYEDAKAQYGRVYKVCGEGKFGICFDLSDGSVAKLHPSIDYAYHAFAGFCMGLEGEEYAKHFPAISYHKRQIDYSVFIMEKLYRYESLPKVEQDHVPSILTPNTGSIFDCFKAAEIRFIQAVNEKLGRAASFPAYNKYKVTPTLEDAFQALLLRVHSSEFCCDLHDYNIMFRRGADGVPTPVIIDPFTPI